MRYSQPIRFGVIWMCLFFVTRAYSQTNSFSVIMDRIHDGLKAGPVAALDRMVERDRQALTNHDSAWADVHYENESAVHLGRVFNFARAYTNPQSRYYGDEGIYHAIECTLAYWYDKNPTNRNWWYNDISHPQRIGEILIVLRYGKKPLPQGLENQLISRMVRKMRVKDGANTSDIALHYLYRACLTHNKATMDSAVQYLFEPVVVATEGEGIQVDNSYFQHGPQQAIASYGKVFVANSWNAAYYLRGTPYALPANQQAILTSFFKNTFLQTCRGSFYDFSVRGRGISRKDSLRAGLGGILQKVKEVDRSESAYWAAAEGRTNLQRPPSYRVDASHTHYWKSNYTNHIRPGYSFSVQTSSARTLRTERGNNENIYGKFLPDGATNIQRRGAEYANIMPVWQWDKLPGITNRHYPTDEGMMITKEWGTPGTTVFAGGVSDSTYGVSAYALNFDSVQAKKAWFFFDKEVVCLGAGINSRAPEAVTTSVNQCWLQGNVLTAAGPVPQETTTPFPALSWVLHDSIGYFFLDKPTAYISNRTQSGSWNHINNSQSKEEVSGQVFTCWLDHGAQPANAHYAYMVVPGLGSKAAMESYPVAKIRALVNTDAIQAVWHTGLDLLQVVFYQPGTLTSGNISVSVDKPCILSIRNSSSRNPIVYIADPTQQQNSIQLTLRLPGLRKAVPLTCALPQGPYAGATAVFKPNNQ